MTRSLVEAWGRLVKWPSTNDAHSWPRSDDRRTMRPTGRGEYGNNRVQEIVSGTGESVIVFVSRHDRATVFLKLHSDPDLAWNEANLRARVRRVTYKWSFRNS